MGQVFLFGAGASREYRGIKGPLFLDTDFFTVVEQMWSDWFYDGEPDPIVGYDRRPYFHGGDRWDWPTLRRVIEVRFNRAVTDLGLEVAFSVIYEKDPECVDAFVRGIELAIFYKIRAVSETELACHAEFFRRVLRPGDTILTFNYDPLIEFAVQIVAQHRGIIWDAGDGHAMDFAGEISATNEESPPEQRARSNIRILKLHGSMNWLVPLEWDGRTAPYLFRLSAGSFKGVGFVEHRNGAGQVLRPLFVPPMPGKVYRALGLGRLWEEAKAALGAAERLTVIGYSFPSTDPDARQLIADANVGLSGPDRVVYITPSESDAALWMKRLFPQADLQFKTFGKFVEGCR